MHSVNRAEYESSLTEEKLQERARKVRLYQAARDRLLAKQSRGEFDEETLELTAKMLEKNADIYTFWNMRRRALLALIASNGSANADSADVDGKVAEGGDQCEPAGEVTKCAEEDVPPARTMDDLIGAELRLTETCLEENPKSYGVWHHRMWCLDRCASANWQREVLLCNKALTLDERNFHCWDYRRHVVRTAGLTAEKELQFADKKLNDNFSNYSAWHYRASLLTKMYPPDGSSGSDITEGILRADRLVSELELAKNALFTDPDDQSAWIYATWLCDNKPAADDSEVSVATKCNGRLCVGFARARRQPGGNVTVSSEQSDDTEIEGNWSTVGASSRSRLWVFEPSGGQFVELLARSNAVRIGDTAVPLNDKGVFARESANLDASASGGLVDAWRQLLECCQQLVDMEPDNKWPRLVAIACLHRLETAKSRHSQVMSQLAKLQELARSGRMFYTDLASRQHIDLAWEESTGETRGDLRGLRLCRTEPPLSTLAPLDVGRLLLVTSIDVSENGLRGLAPLRFALNLTRLTANYNRVEDVAFAAGLHCLRFVSLAGNAIGTSGYFAPLRDSAAPLKSLVVCENKELVENETELKALFAMFTSTRVIPFWL